MRSAEGPAVPPSDPAATPDPIRPSPFASVDLSALDAAFPSLLAHAGAPPASGGLSVRERSLFRFGLRLGAGEWALAAETLLEIVNAGLMPPAALEQAVAEAIVVRGLPVCVHLGPFMVAHGLRAPHAVAEAVGLRRAPSTAAPPPAASSAAELTERDLCALGLSITWGARCWDT
jgi:hypothetical protein